MTIALYVIGGAFVYLLLGLIFIGTEVRWGFPFEYGNSLPDHVREGIARDTLSKSPIKNIVYAPICALCYLICLIVVVIVSALILSVTAIRDFLLKIWDFFLNGFRFSPKRIIIAHVDKSGIKIVKSAD